MTKDADEPVDSNLKNAMFAVGDGVIGAGVLIFIGVMLGNWLDNQFHSAPIGIVLCALLGGGLGLARLVQKAISIGQDDKTPTPPANKYDDSP